MPRFITKKIGKKQFVFKVDDNHHARMNANNLMNTAQLDVGDYIDDLNQAGLINKNNMIVGGQTCNKCKGKGYIDDHICGYCAGIGRRTSSSYYEKI